MRECAGSVFTGSRPRSRGYTLGGMSETERDHGGTVARLFGGAALHRHQLALAAVGAACIAMGILTAVLVPESDGPAAWVMAVAGCLAAGVLLLARVAFARLRPNGGSAL